MDLLVIPDGNRRWAKERGQNYDFGYETLPVTISMIIDTLIEEGTKRLYFWCNSPNNLGRPIEQVYSFLTHYLKILDHATNPDQLRVHVRGNRDIFPGDFSSRFSELEELTRGHEGFDLYYFMNYSTVDDLQRAMKKASESGSGNSMDTILAHMDEPDNIDVILRTGGHRRLSGFIPLKSPNATILFIPEYFPDLTPDRIKEAIVVYNTRIINNGM